MCNWPAIRALLFSRSPPAIFRLIIAIVVDAINRQVRAWARPHVLIKSFKATFPTITNRYSSTAVVFICLMFLIPAASAHAGPYKIFGLFGSSVLCESRNRYLRHITSAACGSSGPNMGCSGNNLSTTVAGEPPFRSQPSCRLNGNEASETLTSQINLANSAHARAARLSVKASAALNLPALYPIGLPNYYRAAVAAELPSELSVCKPTASECNKPSETLTDDNHMNKIQDFETANKWATQVGHRATRLAEQMRTGARA